MSSLDKTPTWIAFDTTVDPRQVPPASQINGSAAGTTISDGVANPSAPTNSERADALNPTVDGVNEKLSNNPVSQDGLTEYLFPGTAPTMTPGVDANGNPLTPEQLFENAVPVPSNPNELPIEDFFGFHSGHQLEYIHLFGKDVPSSTSAKMVTFEQDGDRFDLVAIPGESRVFVLQQLTKTDLAIIAQQTEQALADAISTLPAELRAEIESAVGAASGSQALAALDTLIVDAVEEIDSFFTAPLASGSIEPQDDFSAEQRAAFRAVYTDQLNNIAIRAADSQFLSIDEIRTNIDEIVRRAERANQFFVVVQTPPSPVKIQGKLGMDGQVVTVNTPGQNIDVNAPVGADLSQSGIRDGFDNLIAQEGRIRDLDNQRLQLAQTGLLSGGRALDAPNLIAIFQLNYNLTREAEVNVETEELNQQNELLRIYSAIQQLVNDALREFAAGEDGASEKRTITGSKSDNIEYDDLSQTEKNLIAFIDDLLVKESNVGHPIESLRNIERPTLDVIARKQITVFGVPLGSDHTKLERFSQNTLNIFSSQIGDAVNQITQENQILTNEISNISRESNRNFELANTALRRLNDALTTIGRI